MPTANGFKFKQFVVDNYQRGAIVFHAFLNHLEDTWQEIMDKDLLTVANLFLSFERVQGKVWTLVGPREAKRLESLSHRQVKAMMEVAHRKMGGGEPYTLGELGDLLRIGKSAASLLVSGLVDQGLMTRTTDPKNRRFVRTVIL